MFDRLVLVDIFKLNISFFSICFPVCLFKVAKGFPLGTGRFLLTKIYGSQNREMIAAYVIHYFDICFVVDIGWNKGQVRSTDRAMSSVQTCWLALLVLKEMNRILDI